MMNSLRVIAKLLLDSVYVLRSRHSRRAKLRILLDYGRLTVKLLVVAPLVRLRGERIVGFRVKTFDYETLHFLFREIFVRNQYWFQCPHDRPLILDCGANIGLATLFFKWLYPHSSIHCFEPDRRTFEVLEHNVRINQLDDVHLHNVALSDVDGSVVFFAARNHPGSLLMSMDRQRVNRADVEDTVVDAARLSTFMNGQDVDFLKLDVEGAERLVMTDLVSSGAISRIRELVVEYHHHADRGEKSLGEFLRLVESAGLQYQVDAASARWDEDFQDVLLYAHRPESPRQSPGTLK